MPGKTLATPDIAKGGVRVIVLRSLYTLRRYDNDPDGCIGSAPLI